MFSRNYLINKNNNMKVIFNNMVTIFDIRLLSTTAGTSTTIKAATTITTTIDKHTSASAKLPLIENYRPRWPEPSFNIDETNKLSVSPSSKAIKRTVPDSKLRFKLKSTFDHGASIFYPHLKYHAADYKVTLFVYIDDLGLNNEEKKIFIEMVGKRYNVGKRELKLTAERFPNRIENKRYLILLLESLISETKQLIKLPNKYH